jgi:hypothetical protein
MVQIAGGTGSGRTAGRWARWAVVAAFSLAGSLLPGAGVLAQVPGQVTGLHAEQHHGYTTLSWDPVEGAIAYEIERTPVDAGGDATGPSVITGIWRPNRQINQGSPAFADAGFAPGDRFRWRVRGLTSESLPFSEPVVGDTLPQFGDPGVPGESLRTQWEQTGASQFTSDVNEYGYTADLDVASDRVRFVEIGRTVLGRPINLLIIGYPEPPATAEEIADGPAALVNCNVHGNEPSSREACLIMARELAFSNDPRTIDILSNLTVLFVPAINGDGRAANTRGNSTGQDLNRDHSLLTQPETFALAAMLRDYDPEAAFDGHEFGNSQAGDLPVLPPRHLNVAQSIFDVSKGMMEDWLYSHGSADGWWYCPYGCQGGGNVGLSQETILRNTLGLKNTVSMLLEARSSGGPTRPNEVSAPNNRRRKTYSALYTYHRFLDFFRANQAEILQTKLEAIEFQISNTGPIVFRGSRTIEAFPPPHPGENPPPEEIPEEDQILEEPPCGYVLTEEQYLGPRDDGPEGMVTTLADRIAAHGWRVRHREKGGYLVPLAQPQRGLIPLLLDAQAAEEWVGTVRMYPPPNWPDGVPVPDGTCGRGVGVPSQAKARYDQNYDTD